MALALHEATSASISGIPDSQLGPPGSEEPGVRNQEEPLSDAGQVWPKTNADNSRLAWKTSPGGKVPAKVQKMGMGTGCKMSPIMNCRGGRTSKARAYLYLLIDFKAGSNNAS